MALSLRAMPPSVAAMRRLSALTYAHQPALASLPAGPYRQSLRRLAVHLDNGETDVG